MPTPPPIAVTRRPARSLVSACELTHLRREPVDFERICQEHDAYCQALADIGATVTRLEPLERFPDSVFVEDAAVVLDEVLVLTRPGARSRQAEPATLAAALGAHRAEVRHLRAPACLDGGDVLRIGRRLWVGLSTRTDALGVAQLREAVAPFGYRVDAVALGASLHLKTACTALDDDTVLYNPAWVDGRHLEVPHLIACHPDEPFGANVLRVAEALIVNASFPRTLDRLQAHRHGAAGPLVPVALSEFGKAEAGLTCLSLVFDR